MKIMVQKAVGDQETWGLEVNVSEDTLTKNAEKAREYIQARMNPALKVIDERLAVLGERVVASNRMAAALPGEAQIALHQVIEVMFGRRMPSVSHEAVQADQDAIAREQAKLDAQMDTKVATTLEKALAAVDEGGR